MISTAWTFGGDCLNLLGMPDWSWWLTTARPPCLLWAFQAVFVLCCLVPWGKHRKTFFFSRYWPTLEMMISSEGHWIEDLPICASSHVHIGDHWRPLARTTVLKLLLQTVSWQRYDQAAFKDFGCFFFENYGLECFQVLFGWQWCGNLLPFKEDGQTQIVYYIVTRNGV